VPFDFSLLPDCDYQPRLNAAQPAACRSPILMMRLVSAVLVVLGFTIGCGRTDDAARRSEVDRSRAERLDVVLLSGGRALTQGKSAFTIEFRDGTDPARLVDVGTVKAQATMPMAGSAPMVAKVTMARTSTPGRYAAVSELPMAGKWRLEMLWDGPAGPGRAVLTPAVE
jgi:hypothetical protein